MSICKRNIIMISCLFGNCIIVYKCNIPPTPSTPQLSIFVPSLTSISYSNKKTTRMINNCIFKSTICHNISIYQILIIIVIVYKCTSNELIVSPKHYQSDTFIQCVRTDHHINKPTTMHPSGGGILFI